MCGKARLTHTDNRHKIRKSADSRFLLALQRGLLLELKERGHLNRFQYCRAEEELCRQFRYLPEEKA